MENFEKKFMGGEVVEAVEQTRNGVPVGIIKGYIAAWSVDKGSQFSIPDRFVKGSFASSIAEHHARNTRQVRMKFQHGNVIGGFPISSLKEDDHGLFGEGEVSLKVQEGAEKFALAQQGVLVDFSVGFSSVSDSVADGTRVIEKAVIWEGSLVDEPMNPDAIVTGVKALTMFNDLPLSSRDFKGGIPEDGSGVLYFYDDALPFAKQVDGKTMVVPNLVFKAVDDIKTGNYDVPTEHMPEVKRHIERYYAKMNLDSPFEEKSFYTEKDIDGMTSRQLEKLLTSTGAFSKSAACIIASKVSPGKEQDLFSRKSIIEEMSSLTKELRSNG